MHDATEHTGGSDELDWSKRRRRLRDAPRDVDLFVVALAEIDDWATMSTWWLGEDELARARELREETRRREFLNSRVVLRRLLALRLDCPPEAVELPRNPTTGAPGPARVRGVKALEPGDPVQYSLARTSGYVAVAMANRPVGVDLELRQSNQQSESLLRVLHPSDQSRLLRVPARRRARSVTDAWVRVEALLKARRTGLSVDPSTVHVGAENRVRHPDGLVVTGVRTRRGSQLHAAVAWLEDPLGSPEPWTDRPMGR